MTRASSYIWEKSAPAVNKPGGKKIEEAPRSTALLGQHICDGGGGGVPMTRVEKALNGVARGFLD
jgi:carbamate kinase